MPPDLPLALRRDPDRARPLGGGRAGAARRDRRVRERLPRVARVSAGPARGSAPAAGTVRGGRAPAARATSGTRPPGARGRRSRWREATSRWPRTSLAFASRATIRPILPVLLLLQLLVDIRLARGDLRWARETLDAARRARDRLRGDGCASARSAGRVPRPKRRASRRPPPGGGGALLGARTAAGGCAGAARACRCGRSESSRRGDRRGACSRSERSSAWARCATPTRRPPCCADSGAAGPRLAQAPRAR